MDESIRAKTQQEQDQDRASTAEAWHPQGHPHPKPAHIVMGTFQVERGNITRLSYMDTLRAKGQSQLGKKEHHHG